MQQNTLLNWLYFPDKCCNDTKPMSIYETILLWNTATNSKIIGRKMALFPGWENLPPFLSWLNTCIHVCCVEKHRGKSIFNVLFTVHIRVWKYYRKSPPLSMIGVEGPEHFHISGGSIDAICTSYDNFRNIQHCFWDQRLWQCFSNT